MTALLESSVNYTHIRCALTEEMLEFLKKSRYCIANITDDLFLLPERHAVKLMAYLDKEGIRYEVEED